MKNLKVAIKEMEFLITITKEEITKSKPHGFTKF